MVSADLRNADLVAGEKVLWTGTPVSGMVSNRLALIPSTIFGLFFAGFALFWMWAASVFGRPGHGAPFPFVLFGLPFLLVGLGVAFGPWIFPSIRAKQTSYVLTDKRALEIVNGRMRSVRSYDLDKLTGAQKLTNPDNSGTIIFDLGASYLLQYGARANSQYPYMRPPGFYNIADVDTVYRLLEQAREESKTQS